VKPNIEKVLGGDQLAGAKLIRMLEEGDPMGIEGLKALYAHAGNALFWVSPALRVAANPP